MIKIEEQFRIRSISKHIHDRIFDKEFTFAGEAHDFWEIVYVVNGNIEVAENEKIYVMREGDIIFHAPNEFHKIRAAENTCPRVLNMSFAVEGTLPSNLKEGIFHLNSKQKTTYMDLFEFIKTNLVENDHCDFFIGQEGAGGLTLFILHLCNHVQAQEIMSTTVSALTYHSLVKQMRKEIYNNLSIKMLSEKTYVSISYIKILFQHYAGMSPKKYYNNLRIIEAKYLLEQGMSVTDVANKMNFSSPNYFVRFFKAGTLITPYQYKLQIHVPSSESSLIGHVQ